MNSQVETAEKCRVNVRPNQNKSLKPAARESSLVSHHTGAGAPRSSEELFRPGGTPLRLRLFPDDALRDVAEPVKHFSDELSRFAERMLSFMNTNHAIGLAAPQVGAKLRIFVADVGGGPICLVNPKFAELAMRVRDLEGCLSLPGVTREVKRAALIEVWGCDETGRSQHFEASGLLARLIQHQVDHLDGVLIIDPERGEGTTGTGALALERRRQWGGQPAL